MTRMSAFRTISVGAMLVASTPALSQAPVLTFGLIGDLGYRPAEEPLLQNVLDDLNSNALAFVVHVGDLSSPPYACTDDLSIAYERIPCSTEQGFFCRGREF